jgi:hypothetical protein
LANRKIIKLKNIVQKTFVCDYSSIRLSGIISPVMALPFKKPGKSFAKIITRRLCYEFSGL